MKTKIRSGEARDSMVQVFSPVPVVDEKDLLIQEFFGNVASQQRSLSACVVTVKVCNVVPEGKPCLHMRGIYRDSCTFMCTNTHRSEGAVQ